ncbi:hypothetical protein SAMN04488057_102252 [Cyclobacterium lianum]|uniref:Uncharacterized protein n=1 Tax=Cyclobacterium lianum TaxID=388280 RepID=A0A1M7K1S8_9BACT|nr:hypothetical protein SAMN04488057_102252 [Cyclobacterium lianum]
MTLDLIGVDFIDKRLPFCFCDQLLAYATNRYHNSLCALCLLRVLCDHFLQSLVQNEKGDFVNGRISSYIPDSQMPYTIMVLTLSNSILRKPKANPP